MHHSPIKPLSKEFLLERGCCCESGCTNCPYGFEKMIIKYSKEILYHFNCGNCKKWWSVADYILLKLPKDMNTLTCPHCAKKGNLKHANSIEDNMRKRY